MYAGTYTGHGSKGIYAWRFQTANGKLTPLGVAAETGNPSFLVEHPSHRFVYAVNENGDRNVLGTVSAYAVDLRSPKLAPLNWVSSKGGAPCHLAIDKTGKWLAVANCAGGSVAILPIQSDGHLGESAALDPHPGSHVQGVAFAPDNRFLLAAGDRGIQVYRFNPATGGITPAALTATAAGRLAFHPSGQTLYALGASSVTTFRYDAAGGNLAELQTDPLAGPGTASSILVNRQGSVLYVSDPDLNALAQFAIDAEKFTLTPMEYPPTMGRSPRHFAIDPTGAYLFVANRDSANLTIFRVHPHTGQLQPAAALGKNVPDAACVVFVPVGR